VDAVIGHAVRLRLIGRRCSAVVRTVRAAFLFPYKRSDVRAIEACHVYKIFGRKAEEGVKQLQSGATQEDLQKRGITAAVIDVSFEVEPGEIFVVMGLSGSGKSGSSQSTV
jgi:ABC-type sugar transport system ATPase subunit